MGGTKRKISTDTKIEKKESKSVAFSKRRNGLYSKASQLCALTGSQVAILATPPCSNSSVSFYSFGHSSVDNVVSAFLNDQHPREDLGSEFWWEDKRLAESEDPEELSEAVDSISRMLQTLKGLRSKVVDQSQTLNVDRNQTLGFKSCSASHCAQDVFPENVEELVNKKDDQIVAVSDSDNALPAGDLYECNTQEFDIDQIFDLVPSTDDLTMNSEMDDVSMMMMNTDQYSNFFSNGEP